MNVLQYLYFKEFGWVGAKSLLHFGSAKLISGSLSLQLGRSEEEGEGEDSVRSSSQGASVKEHFTGVSIRVCLESKFVVLTLGTHDDFGFYL